MGSGPFPQPRAWPAPASPRLLLGRGRRSLNQSLGRENPMESRGGGEARLASLALGRGRGRSWSEAACPVPVPPPGAAAPQPAQGRMSDVSTTRRGDLELIKQLCLKNHGKLRWF